jgi:predicted GTPase
MADESSLTGAQRVSLQALIPTKNAAILALERAKSERNLSSVAELATRAAELEALVVTELIAQGDTDRAVVNMISMASCLSDANHVDEAREALYKALALARKVEVKTWIESEIAKLDTGRLGSEGAASQKPRNTADSEAIETIQLAVAKEFEAFAKKVNTINILLIGRAAVGKTTLINKVFGDAVPNVVGRKGSTYAYVWHGQDTTPITVYDSPGLSSPGLIEDTLQFVEPQQKQGPAAQIHLVWYVVSAASARIEGFEIDLIERLDKYGIPVVFVLSQTDVAIDSEKQEILQVLRTVKARVERVSDIVEVAASPLQVSGKPIRAPFGLEELVGTTEHLLPRVYRDAFVAAQSVSIRAKRNTAYSYVIIAAGACFVSGSILFRFTTVATTYLVLRRLAAKLAALFGFQNLRNFDDLHKEVIRSPDTTLTAIIKTLLDSSANPVIGTASGVAAATYMTRVGLALASTFEEMARLELEAAETRQEIEGKVLQIFKRKFEAWRKLGSVGGTGDLENFRRDYVEGNAPSSSENAE